MSEKKLSTTQEEALNLLTDKWQSARRLGMRSTTLDVLVREGLAEVSKPGGFSYEYNTSVYKLKLPVKVTQTEKERLIDLISNEIRTLFRLKNEIVYHDRTKPLPKHIVKSLGRYGIE